MKPKFKKETNLANIPFNGVKIFNPKYRNMLLSEVINHSNVKKEYVPYGYNLFIFHSETGTLYCYNN